MARVEGRGKCCSYKRITVVICSINIVAALYILHHLYTSLYIFSNNASPNAGRYSRDQTRRIDDLIRIRKASESIELVKLVKEINEESSREKKVTELSHPVKQDITHEILQRLKGLKANANVSEQREAVECWRKEKLEEVKQLIIGQTTMNSTIPAKEAKKLVRALESDWIVLLEEIGLWMPTEIINKEHNDKSEADLELEDHIIPGRSIPPECHAEIHTDYDGAAVRWGLTHHKESAADCCQACLDQAKHAKLGEMKCNMWVYCPSDTGCYSPDIYEHKNQECWLKHDVYAHLCISFSKQLLQGLAEKPRLNFKDKYSESYRNAHPTAPLIVPWISGVVSA